MREQQKKDEISGRWALVSGSSRGIGRHIALALAGLGCNLILHSRTLANTKDLVQEVSALGVGVHAVEAELDTVAAVRGLVGKVLSLVPQVDIVYNNAAIMSPYRQDWLTVEPDDYARSFQVNTLAPIILANGLLPRMIKAGWGRIINITSGIKDQPELMAYAASKAALDKYTMDMAVKLEGTGVSMNLLDPGWLKTDLGGSQAPGEVESVLPGALVPLWLGARSSGVLFRAQDYHGKTLDGILVG